MTRTHAFPALTLAQGLIITGSVLALTGMIWVIVGGLGIADSKWSGLAALLLIGFGATILLVGLAEEMDGGPRAQAFTFAGAIQMFMALLLAPIIYAETGDLSAVSSVGLLFVVGGVLLCTVLVEAPALRPSRVAVVPAGFMMDSDPSPKPDRSSADSSPADDLAALMITVCDLSDDLERSRRAVRMDKRQHLLHLLSMDDSLRTMIDAAANHDGGAEPSTDQLLAQMRSVRRTVQMAIEEAGARPITAPDGRATPGMFTILETREVAGLEDYVILEELERGYVMEGELIRPATVVVVRNHQRDTIRHDERRPQPEPIG